MATTIGNLRVIISARTAGFARGLARAGQTVRTFGAQVRSAARRVTGLGGSLTALAAGGGLTYLGTRAARSLDQLAKTSDKLGTTTEGLATLQHVAGLAGVEVATFNMALQRMSRRAGEAKAGIGIVGKHFAALGIDIRQFVKVPGDEAFILLAQALGKVDNQMLRVARAAKIFDSEGVAVVNMIELLTKRYAEMVALTESLGIRFTRTQLALIEQMNDAFFNLRTKIYGIVGQTLVRLAPYLTAIFDKIRTSIGHPAKVADWLVAKLAWLGRKFLQFLDWLRVGALKFGQFVLAVSRVMIQAMSAVADWFGDAPELFSETLAAIDRLRGGINALLGDLAAGREKTIAQQITEWFQEAARAAGELAQQTGRRWAFLGFIPEMDAALRRTLNTLAERAGKVWDIAGLLPSGRLRMLHTAVELGKRAAKLWASFQLLPGAEPAAQRAAVAWARPMEYGGFVRPGVPAITAFRTGDIELSIQREQLEELRQIKKALKAQQKPALRA